MNWRQYTQISFFSAILLTILSLFGQTPCWAMQGVLVEESIDADQELRKRAVPQGGLLPKKTSKKQRTHKEVVTPRVLPQTSTASSSHSQRRTLYTQFREILASPPCPLPEMNQITASQEDQGGSRKWVKFFCDPTDIKTHEWHQKMPKIIMAVRQQNDKGRYFPVETNFAGARLVFVLQDEEPQFKEIPYFFASGWPANANRPFAHNFSKALADEKLGEELKPYKSYGLRFITKSYQAGEETELRSASYDPFRDEIQGIMDKELEAESSIPGKERLQIHSKLMKGSGAEILGKLYFHSEQAIWMTVKDEITKFRETLKKRSTGDIRSYLSKTLEQAPVDPIRHVFLDICSFYDVCWCCGDTLARCSHTLSLGVPVYVRASGCSAYYDRPFEVKPPYALRDHRQEFPGYEEGRSFSIPGPGQNNDLFQPYVAHSVASDFQ